MTGIPFTIAFVVAVLAMLLMISKWKVHPFLSIMVTTLKLQAKSSPP